ncbi:bifunctional diaminohydroxyphosphoribosylaminopyrimidine deaminase/5-amino-6-(5-phosphoribosylamino)uracil reductase RibD [Candidatus Peregrinibacteria bacterium]|nr:bifunctional diaminohydroxyphosphoribosylaminopyrimidine deaminase/5-amino-6-(5-phosphoribosylamino)uracil reductase RibD [Candidatus Peregrinibacteria bacterium]MBT7736579.1 bifunctional diaminohydroxyphosphoribosylaminopyrimidine deaminase/5-amino-6-(5-phosphoribosylamino)uracil reductase RibD [Candidatus Peregrinibacteria bacterium]
MDKKYFERAILIASKRKGLTSPNPVVGAVIVKGGRIVSEGAHVAAGESHAEVLAIKSLMAKSGVVYTDLEPALFSNAELYVTLEPCCHSGKTPPCVDLIVRAGFKKVYVGMLDPYSKVNGKGVKILKKAGVQVEVLKSGTPLSDEIRNLNQSFIKWASLGLPYVTLKAGMSLDGKIATSAGDSKWITSEKSRNDARLERSIYDAVLVGASTVRNDDCELAPHGKFKRKNLVRCIVGRKLNLPLKMKVFRDPNVVYFVQDLGALASQEKYKRAGVTVKKIADGPAGIRQALKYLAKKGVQSVFVEGGSRIHGLFIDTALKSKNIVDGLLFYISPKIIGGSKSLPVVGGTGALKLSGALKAEKLSVSSSGEDFKVEGVVNSY